MHPPRILVLATILGVLAAGCTPAPAPTPTPTVTVPTCTPEFGGTPFPCTQAEYELSQKTQQRYAEAERVYHEYNDLSAQESVERLPEPSARLLELTAGKYRDNLPEVRKKSLAVATYSGQMPLLWSRPAPTQAGDIGSLVIIACVDRSEWKSTFTDGSAPPSTLKRAHRVQFDEGIGPRIVGIEAAEDPQCA